MTKGYSKGDIAGKLKKLQGNLTQREFATIVGVSQPYLGDVLQGNRWPGKKLLDYLRNSEGLDLEHGFIERSKTSM